MNYLLIYIFVLLLIIVLLLTVQIYGKTLTNTKIIYKAKEDPITLDTQFSPTNFPSYIYQDVFSLSSPWIGGSQIGINSIGVFQTQLATPYNQSYFLQNTQGNVFTNSYQNPNLKQQDTSGNYLVNFDYSQNSTTANLSTISNLMISQIPSTLKIN